MPTDLTNLYGGYQRASRFSPVPKSTLRRALKPYGIKLGSLAGQTDSQLRQLAISSVLKKRSLKPKRKRGAASQPIQPTPTPTAAPSRARRSGLTARPLRPHIPRRPYTIQ